MTSELLAQILTERLPCERRENTLHVPAHTALSLYVTLANENLIVERIASIELASSVVVANTSRNEEFFFLYEDIRGLRLHRG